MRRPHGSRTATYDARTGFLQILVVSIILPARKGAVGPRTDPVGYEEHLRFPYGARTTPARAPHGFDVESWELFDQTVSVQPCQATQGP